MSGWPDLRVVAQLAVLAMLSLPGPAKADPTAVIRDPALPQDTKGLDFEIGRALFDRQWAAAPSSTQAADGLGPLFNARSCNSCHPRGGRGTAFDAGGAPLPALLLKLGPHGGMGRTVGDPVYGQQIQEDSVAGLSAEATLGMRFETQDVTLGDGKVVTLRRPVPLLDHLAYGALAPHTVISPRLATAINGIGLLAQIPDVEILERADPGDADGDGVSGKPNTVTDPATGRPALGRFGWKSGQATLQAQDAKALDLDIGLSNPLYRDPYGDCTPAEPQCRAMPNGASPQFEGLEVPSSLMRLIDRFVAEAVLPAAAVPDDVARGRTVFQEAGCESCHRARFTLPAAGTVPAREIAPYSDLLLHDMGPGLADHMAEGAASGREWRTAPLWGIGHALADQESVSLLHDGRARTALEAVLWHDGEAAPARRKVEQLSAADRQALIDFIGSL